MQKEELRFYYIIYSIVPPLLRQVYGINKKMEREEKKKKTKRKNKYVGSWEVKSGLGYAVEGGEMGARGKFTHLETKQEAPAK